MTGSLHRTRELKLKPSGKKSEYLFELKEEFRRLTEFWIDTFMEEIYDEGEGVKKGDLREYFMKTNSKYSLKEKSEIIKRARYYEGMLDKVYVSLKNFDDDSTGKIQPPKNGIDCLAFQTRIVNIEKTNSGEYGITIKSPIPRGAKVPERLKEKYRYRGRDGEESYLDTEIFIKIEEEENLDSHVEEIKENGSEDTFSCEIIHDNGNWYLKASVNEGEAPEFPENKEVEYIIGVDTGIKYTATVCVWDRERGVVDVKFFEGIPLNEKLDLDSKVSELQVKGKKEAYNRWKDKKGNKIDYQNHEVSKRIVELAEEYKPCKIFVEDLEGSKNSMEVGSYKETGQIKGKEGRFKNRLRSNWSPSDLIEKLTYKAEERGIEVDDVYPRGTSSKCPECGKKGKRTWGKHFKCTNEDCGFTELNDDLVGALNIAKRGDKKISA